MAEVGDTSVLDASYLNDTLPVHEEKKTKKKNSKKANFVLEESDNESPIQLPKSRLKNVPLATPSKKRKEKAFEPIQPVAFKGRGDMVLMVNVIERRLPPKPKPKPFVMDEFKKGLQDAIVERQLMLKLQKEKEEKDREREMREKMTLLPPIPKKRSNVKHGDHFLNDDMTNSRNSNFKEDIQIVTAVPVPSEPPPLPIVKNKTLMEYEYPKPSKFIHVPRSPSLPLTLPIRIFENPKKKNNKELKRQVSETMNTRRNTQYSIRPPSGQSLIFPSLLAPRRKMWKQLPGYKTA